MPLFDRWRKPSVPVPDTYVEKSDESIERIKVRFSRRLKRITELGLLGLTDNQVFPPRVLMEASHVLPEPIALIRKETPVGSMGSCFAREIRDHLIAEGYNYIQYGTGKDVEHGSARWNRVYNTGCIKQELQRAFEKFECDLLEDGRGQFIDPHRKNAVYESRDKAEYEIDLYRQEAKMAFLESKVFIFTLGLSEVWYNEETGKIYAEAPPSAAFNAKRDKFRLLSPSENTENLRAALTLYKKMNPDVKIVLTVSPVPLRATFLPRSALVSNTVSKASLVWAAHEISQELDFVHYFPSYEIVQYMENDPFEWDYRHVKRETVARIMKLFRKAFVV